MSNENSKNMEEKREDKKIDNIINTLFDKAVSFSLADSEKESILQKFTFETASPFYIPKERLVVLIPQSTAWYDFFTGKRTLAGALVLVLFVLGGGTSFAARSAIPGDVLYPIKIHVNEEAQTFFSLGTKSTAKTHAIHALARLEEVEKLAKQDKLNATTTVLAKAQFTNDANNVTQNVEKLSQDGDASSATEVGTDFQTSLQDHQDILTNLSEKGGNQSGLLSDLAGTVTTHLYTTAAVNLNIELGINATSTPTELGTTTPIITTTATTTATSTTPVATTTEKGTEKTSVSTSTTDKIKPTQGIKPLKIKSQ